MGYVAAFLSGALFGAVAIVVWALCAVNEEDRRD